MADEKKDGCRIDVVEDVKTKERDKENHCGQYQTKLVLDIYTYGERLKEI